MRSSWAGTVARQATRAGARRGSSRQRRTPAARTSSVRSCAPPVFSVRPGLSRPRSLSSAPGGRGRREGAAGEAALSAAGGRPLRTTGMVRAEGEHAWRASASYVATSRCRLHAARAERQLRGGQRVRNSTRETRKQHVGRERAVRDDAGGERERGAERRRGECSRARASRAVWLACERGGRTARGRGGREEPRDGVLGSCRRRTRACQRSGRRRIGARARATLHARPT